MQHHRLDSNYWKQLFQKPYSKSDAIRVNSDDYSINTQIGR